MQQLSHTKDPRLAHKLNELTPSTIGRMMTEYTQAKNRLLLFDYDGVLTDLIRDTSAEASRPTPELLATLTKLAATNGNQVMVLSGRPKEALISWFGNLSIALGAEHGAWVKRHDTWQLQCDYPSDWKAPYLPVIERITRLTPGSHIEHKQFSLIWHYRNVGPELVYDRETQLKRALGKIAAGTDIGVFQGHKIIEVKPRLVSKGTAAAHMLAEYPYDFMLAIGDDYNDEEMYAALPPTAYTIKVGLDSTGAKYHLKSPTHVKALLGKLAAIRP